MASTMWKTLVVLFSFVSLILGASLPDGMALKTPVAGLGLPIGEMVFTGSIHGVDVQLNGTAESIHAQFEALHPGVAAANANHTISARDDYANLDRRNGIIPPLCNVQAWPQCPISYIRKGETYLRGLNGGCYVDARTCTRISCSYDSAIYLCNDNYYSINPTCAYLANYAEDIIGHCETYWSGQYHVTGQEFDTDGYNVVVKGDSC